MKNMFNKIKKYIWEFVIILGASPLAFALLSGIYKAIAGFSGLCIKGCTDSYGFSAFMDWVILFSFVFWPIYVIGLILMILGIIMVKRKNKEK